MVIPHGTLFLGKSSLRGTFSAKNKIWKKCVGFNSGEIVWWVLVLKVWNGGTKEWSSSEHGNSDRLARGLQCCICKKEALEWKICYPPQDHIAKDGCQKLCQVLRNRNICLEKKKKNCNRLKMWEDGKKKDIYT